MRFMLTMLCKSTLWRLRLYTACVACDVVRDWLWFMWEDSCCTIHTYIVRARDGEISTSRALLRIQYRSYLLRNTARMQRSL